MAIESLVMFALTAVVIGGIAWYASKHPNKKN